MTALCIIGVMYNEHPDYQLVLAANRDEFKSRPTARPFFREEGMLAGKDEMKGGTWLGINRSGRFAAVTNIRSGQPLEAPAFSRGELVPAWVNDDDFDSYIARRDETDGFNLLYGTMENLFYVNNKEHPPHELKSGIYSLSNADLYTLWPKTKQLQKDLMKAETLQGEQLVSYLFDALAKRDAFPDEMLPDTGVGIELERRLSSAFIDMPEYGTRCSTVILVDRSGSCQFIEHSSFEEPEIRHEFVIKP
ncbi:NRDE family protein [Alkalicoccus luteus]|uniref:NRDE family protein n=1 Tax=Alkalicoccus luteus TaxID=1237094 RepID=A0A969PR35_9BACI|nr:NRDE family protein [Alkalicoccus luteus]NJP38876.1 NRDE family protein [Alkalicoccus luteus]